MCASSPLSPLSPTGQHPSTPPPSSPPLIRCSQSLNQSGDYPPLSDGHAPAKTDSNGVSSSGSEVNDSLINDNDYKAHNNTQPVTQASTDSSDLDCLHNVMGEDDMTSSSKSSFEEIKPKDLESPHSPWYFLYLRVSQSSQQNNSAPVVGIAIPQKNKELVTVRTWFVFAIPSNR